MMWGSKRYHTLDYEWKTRYGGKVCKVALDPGFSCPNRDGTKSHGGCIYCSAAKSGEQVLRPTATLREQFDAGCAVLRKKWKDARFMPYFQAGTGTYAPISQLKARCEEALSFPDIPGLCIATRPDCMPDETLDYFVSLSHTTDLYFELGLQSTYNRTLDLINRHSTYEEFLDCFARLRKCGIPVCVHLINGLPGETRDMMLENVRRIASLAPFAVKLHLLYILKGTVCESMLRDHTLFPMEREDYLSLICDQIECLPVETVIERLTGDGPLEELVAPMWSRHKMGVLNAIDAQLIRRDTYQGSRWAGT